VSPLSTSFPALGTTATVAVRESGALPDARAMLERELERIDLACSRFRPDSELAIANAAAGREVAVSHLFAEALEVALDAARETDGLVDPTLGMHLCAAGYNQTFALVRARGSWALTPRPRLSKVWQEVGLDASRRLVFVPAGVQLDLGATAKAFAADRAARAIAESIGSGTLVSLGGDVAVCGSSPPGGWCVGIADDHRAPIEAGTPRVLITSGGLATSSTSTRCWPTDRGKAHHILDPASGLPAKTPWRTVSVAAHSCVAANVASTAAVVLGSRARKWLTLRGLHARLVSDDGAIELVCGWPPDAAREP
jgi:thiamine biosynthesis lipoprotein